MMFNQIEPIEMGDTEFIPLPFTPRRRRCNPEVRAFMTRALREFETNPEESSIDVPIDKFAKIGLEPNIYTIVSSLESCPESEYIKIEPSEDIIKLIKVGEPETRAVKHYNPRYHEEI